MRLEQLFFRLDHFIAGQHTFDKQAAISVLMDILTIFGRNDLKSEVLKELDRHFQVLNKMAGNAGVDTDKLENILEELNLISKRLYQYNGKIGIKVLESNLFQSITQRSSIPGGACSFDLPGFHYWLEQEENILQQDLTEWTEPLVEIRIAIDLILKFIRQSGSATEELAVAGFFQLNLDQTKPFQIIKVAIENPCSSFAEISGGKHRFSIRFMKGGALNNQRPVQIIEDVPFLLTRCLF